MEKYTNQNSILVNTYKDNYLSNTSTPFKISRLAISITCAIMLTACNGGGGGSNSSNTGKNIENNQPPVVLNLNDNNRQGKDTTSPTPDPTPELIEKPPITVPNTTYETEIKFEDNQSSRLKETIITSPSDDENKNIVDTEDPDNNATETVTVFEQKKASIPTTPQDINLTPRSPHNPFTQVKETIPKSKLDKYLENNRIETNNTISSSTANSRKIKNTKDKYDGIKEVTHLADIASIEYKHKENSYSRTKKENNNKYNGINKNLALFSIASVNNNTLSSTVDRDVNKRWNEKNLADAFNWDRLERDVTDYKITTFVNGVDYDLSNLSTKINQDLAKIVVLDANITLNSNLYSDRLDKTEYIKPNSNYKNGSSYLGHGDKVIGQLIGKQNNYVYRIPDKYDYRLGFLKDKGKVTFIGYQPKNFKGSSFNALVSSKNLYEAIALNGYNILNISLSNAIDSKNLTDINSNIKTRDLNYYLRFLDYYAKHYDILTVIAAGNYYNKKASSLAYSGLVYKDKYPNFYHSQLTVGAYNPATKQAEDYSNHCNENKDTCLFAIGTTITYTNPEYLKTHRWNEKYSVSNGTSFSAPYVSGTLALVRSVFPFMTNYNVQQTVLTTALDLGEKGVDNIYGWGLIQPLSAIRGPKQFYKDNFKVDFKHNYQYQKNNEIYRFSNDISGDYGLEVYGSNKHNVLSLSGVNTYKGNTVLYPLAIVNIDGVIANSDILTTPNSYLYGSGWINNLYNQGTLSNYSIFATKNNHQNETRSQYGMVINGNYIQGKSGKLNVLLGQPLLVKGNATLAGILNIAGFKKVFIENKTIIGDALVAQGTLKGKFKTLTSTPLLEAGTVNYQKVNINNHKTINVVSVTATYSGVVENLSKFILPKEEIYPLAKNGAENIDKLYNSIRNNNHPSTNRSYDEFNKLSRLTFFTSEVSEEENTHYSPLKTLLTDIQAETNKDSLRKSILSLSGSEFVNAYQQNERLINFTNQKNRESLLTNNIQGFQVGYKYSQLFGKNKNKIRLNQLNLNYLTGNNISLLFGLNSANISNQDTVFNSDNSGKSKAINFAISYPLLDKLNLNYQISYSDLKGKLNRNGSLDNQPYAYQHNYHYKSLINELFISHKLILTSKQLLTPYYGVSLTKTKIDKINEAHTGDFNLVLAQQTKNSKAWFAGLIYQYQQPFDLTNTNIYLVYQLSKIFNTNNQLEGYLQDDTLTSPLSFYNTNAQGLVQNLNLTLNTKITKNISLNSSFNTNLKQEKGFNLGISYQFK